MPDHSFLGLSSNDVTAISAVASVTIAVVALILTLINLKVLHRINTVDSMRWVNEKFTELNCLQLSNDEIIKLSFFNKVEGEMTKNDIEEFKRNFVTYNYINILESIYIQMVYKTLNKSHATSILDSFIPKLLSNEKAKECLIKGGYDPGFVSYCLDTYQMIK